MGLSIPYFSLLLRFHFGFYFLSHFELCFPVKFVGYNFWSIVFTCSLLLHMSKEFALNGYWVCAKDTYDAHSAMYACMCVTVLRFKCSFHLHSTMGRWVIMTTNLWKLYYYSTCRFWQWHKTKTTRKSFHLWGARMCALLRICTVWIFCNGRVSDIKSEMWNK